MPIEILISTMFRTDLSFLEAMFEHNQLSDFRVLIINQTDEDSQLESTIAGVRVVNTSERGLPQSRNMAIAHAQSEICLVADDDVVYAPGLEQIILKAYSHFSDADVITFKMNNLDGTPYREYPDVSLHTVTSVDTVNGVVISFKRESLLQNNVGYNNHFGLGATFGTANEYVFMRNCLSGGLSAYFYPEVILSHPEFSSGKDEGSDRVVYARAALNYKYHGFWSYLWVLKYVRFLRTHHYIERSEIKHKVTVGYQGISRYRDLLRQNLETR